MEGFRIKIQGKERVINLQAPSLEQMLEFCSDLDGFLSQNPANFAAVHCKVDIDSNC